ncbi:YigZ family protein [Goodfellowiella coeruleoviolacea]|uniref:Uncharacterized protein, YigZ family n=1 Tax=Goodfellowiella coeruleoviolacea TaxID=334858 RepID=A0AAE3GFV5_9PSEU|nr:YigZ family protein [Goodfellowiella coeruleoviolacea]MCP2166599.1 uncharacterized protein, YigZ family [Goodfellowiella coeruleoviolacea]
MHEGQLVIRGTGTHEIEINRSRFLCSVARATDERQAEAFIAGVRREHWNATHNCTAFRIGEHAQLQRSSDDGEPAGTAGVPMLEVLRRRGLTDTVVVVTRYFGGVKLGAGGLVRAYGRAVSETIDRVGTLRRRAFTEMAVTTDHAGAGRLEHALREAGHRIAEVDYAAAVRFTVLVPVADEAGFATWLAERTGGRGRAVPGARVLVEVAAE